MDFEFDGVIYWINKNKSLYFESSMENSSLDYLLFIVCELVGKEFSLKKWQWKTEIG